MIKWIFSILTIAFSAYLYIHAHNRLIELKIALPPLQRQIREIRAENERLQFEIDRFESPAHLMSLAEKPEFSHLKPASDIISIPYEK